MPSWLVDKANLNVVQRAEKVRNLGPRIRASHPLSAANSSKNILDECAAASNDDLTPTIILAPCDNCRIAQSQYGYVAELSVRPPTSAHHAPQ